MYTAQFNNFTSPPQKLDDSRVIFAAAAPALALFIESFSATSFELGVLVWVAAVVSIYAACLADLRYLRTCGFDVGVLSKAMLLPPLYLIKRSKLVGTKAVLAGVMIGCTLYALVSNNFIAAARLTDDDKLDYVRDNYAQVISGVESSGMSTVSQMLRQYVGDEEISWSESENSGRITVTAQTEQLKIVFVVPFDGYAFGDISVTELVENGVRLEGDEFSEKLNEIFSENEPAKSEPADSEEAESRYTKA